MTMSCWKAREEAASRFGTPTRASGCDSTAPFGAGQAGSISFACAAGHTKRAYRKRASSHAGDVGPQRLRRRAWRYGPRGIVIHQPPNAHFTLTVGLWVRLKGG